MSVQDHHIQTTRTARYYTLGKVHEGTKEIWLVVHGYAQLAATFIQHFEVMKGDARFIIAPEGLSRFYAKGFGGHPVASWMTSEDRIHEIKDYVNFIEQLMQQIIPANYQGKINLLGFSQGVATVTRWMHETHFKVDELFIYAGQIANELVNPLSEKLTQTKITYITGTKDPLLKHEQKEQVMQLMHQLNARFIEFEGGHEVREDVLLKALRV